MKQAQNGDQVAVHYHGKLNDGTTFDSSEGRDPLTFTVGSGQVIKGFDDAVLMMSEGDKKTVVIACENGYGTRNEDMIIEFPTTEFPADMTPVVGLEIQMSDDQGNVFPVVITEVHDGFVVMDANHPLAGKDLTFDLHLVNIL